MAIELSVNGLRVEVDADDEASLLVVLRDYLGLTGTKYGCGEGECGACTVLVESDAVRSCVTPVAGVMGKDITTIEGLERGGHLHPLQQAFLDTGAFQCGYCTPGMIMAAVRLLHACPGPTNQEIVAAMQGNICRCGGYRRIVQAIRQASQAPNAALEEPGTAHTGAAAKEAAV
jgi:aerobic-type carbon monoxide dehydrogenase small subunit (CoxS/CutS family)